MDRPLPTALACSFSRHADVVQALHDARLLPVGQRADAADAHAALREAVTQALPPALLAAWRTGFAAQARTLIDALPAAGPVDLVAALAEPWALQVAAVATGVPHDAIAPCDLLARRLFQAAAESRDGTLAADAPDAAAQLARLLGTLRPGGPADVQTFVALSQSLPALLAGAWLALLREPAALAVLLAEPARVARSVGELIRLGSPAQAVFREACAETTIGGTTLRRGDRVALLLAAANRDPACFADPDRLDLARDTSAALSFGSGPHRCAGTSLVRLAVGLATQALLERSAALALADPAAATVWRGGHAMRSPARLMVLRVARTG